MDIDTLSRTDVTGAQRLSTQAGWNQIAADWHRLLDLAPEHCFGGWVDDELVATGTLVTYDDTVGWIGMILVDNAHRRNGYGTAMFEHILEIGSQRDVDVGLDATEAGRSVYEPAGFVDVEPIERWYGELSSPTQSISPEYPPSTDHPSSPDHPPSTDRPSSPEYPPSQDHSSSREHTDGTAGESTDCRLVNQSDVDTLCELDRQACGVDRRKLLEHLLAADRTTGLVLRDDDTETEDRGPSIQGYAILRPGREYAHVGPVVARSPENVSTLLSGAASVLDGEPILIDVLSPGDIEHLLERFGLQCQRELVRMTYREPTDLLVGDDVVAAAGFELG